jgi:hypothetical protein
METTGGGAGGDRDADDAAGLSRHYANHLGVEFSLSEVSLRFGQQHGPDAEPAIHTLIVSSPVHLAAFGRVIQASIARYETRFGRIPDSSETPAPTALGTTTRQ